MFILCGHTFYICTVLYILYVYCVVFVSQYLEDQSSPVVEHFQHLRRQWAARMQLLHTQLMSVASVDMSPVLGEVMCVHIHICRKTKYLYSAHNRVPVSKGNLSLHYAELTFQLTPAYAEAYAVKK